MYVVEISLLLMWVFVHLERLLLTSILPLLVPKGLTYRGANLRPRWRKWSTQYWNPYNELKRFLVKRKDILHLCLDVEYSNKTTRLVYCRKLIHDNYFILTILLFRWPQVSFILWTSSSVLRRHRFYSDLRSGLRVRLREEWNRSSVGGRLSHLHTHF